jgi:cyclophilin family peptidyl-prolyl cis-trans isomerase
MLRNASGPLAVLGLLASMAMLAACGSASPAHPTPKQTRWSSPPAMAIDLDKAYAATFKTAKGDIQVELLAKQAPKAVNSFVFLARQGFYDNTTFHRVLKDFMAQGGDPSGTGGGGPGYSYEDEIDPGVQFDRPGLLGMANSGANTNGSQFFLTFVPTPWLNGHHTIFGRVTSGMDVLLTLTLRDPEKAEGPGDLLKTVVIEEK